MYPLVRELAADGVPVTVTCRVLKIARQPYYRWLARPVTDAELRHCIRTEHVRTLDDLKRRCRLGLGADGGVRCAPRAAQILCEELDLDPDLVPEITRDFLQTRWEDRRGITRGDARAAEALAMGWQSLSGQLGVGWPGAGPRAADDVGERR